MRPLAAILGLLFGLGLGLGYAWFLSPVEYTDTEPSLLRADYKAEIVQLIAAAYAADGDVERARARVASLELGDPAGAVTARAQQLAASGADMSSVQSLADLAAALGGQPAAVTPIAQAATLTPAPTETLVPTPLPSATPFLTATPIVLPGLPTVPPITGVFTLTSTETLCEAGTPLLQVVAQTAAGEGLRGVEVIVEWAGGQDRFFTGLKPERGAGYGDFEMQPAIDYTVRLADAPDAAHPARSEPCTDTNGNVTATSVRLTFTQP
jgi:hypothetical protein